MKVLIPINERIAILINTAINLLLINPPAPVIRIYFIYDFDNLLFKQLSYKYVDFIAYIIKG